MSTPVAPNVIPSASEPLPDSNDLNTWPVRMQESHRWIREDAAPGMNALGENVYQNALSAYDAATAAAGAANIVGPWASQSGAAAPPYSVTHIGRIWTVALPIADITLSEPSAVNTDWVDITGVRRSGDIMLGPLEVLPNASGAQAPQAQEVALLASTTFAYRNKLLNPFSENQRGFVSAADDAYCLDRWYILTETGSVTVAQIDEPESGAPFGIRLTQPSVTAKRIGLAQIIEYKNIKPLASAAMNLFARVKLSTAGTIRYAILEHTGTKDVVTSDVVNDWTSAVFTPSNFFIAGVSVLKTGTVTPGAATFGDIDDWTVLSSGVKNVVIFFWTEAVLIQNGTLEINRPQFEPGVVATPHEWRMDELQLCQRYYEEGKAFFRSRVFTAGGYGTQVFFKVEKRTVPAIVKTDTSGAGFPAAGNVFETTTKGYQAYKVANADVLGGYFDQPFTASAEL